MTWRLQIRRIFAHGFKILFKKRASTKKRHTVEIVLEETLLRKPLAEYDNYLLKEISEFPREIQLKKCRIALSRIEAFINNIKEGRASERYIRKREESTEKSLNTIYRMLYAEDPTLFLFDEREVEKLTLEINERINNPTVHDKLADWDFIKTNFPRGSQDNKYTAIYNITAKVIPLSSDNPTIRENLLDRLNETQLTDTYRILKEIDGQLSDVTTMKGRKSTMIIKKMVRVIEQYCQERSRMKDPLMSCGAT